MLDLDSNCQGASQGPKAGTVIVTYAIMFGDHDLYNCMLLLYAIKATNYDGLVKIGDA